MAPEHHDTVAVLAVKLAPSGVPATLLIFGVPLPVLVQLAALVYTLLQIGAFLLDRCRAAKARRKENADG